MSRMSTTSVRVLAVSVVGSAVLLSTGSAHAAEPRGGPSKHASCVGQIFVPQATGEPGAVAARIAEIREFLLPVVGENFGRGISRLAGGDC